MDGVRVIGTDVLKINVVARGPLSSGKTLVLQRISELLSELKFECDDVVKLDGGLHIRIERKCEVLNAYRGLKK